MWTCRSRFTSAISVSLLIVGASIRGVSLPRSKPAARGVGGRNNLTITLRMYNYAVSRRLLSQAEAEATVILAYAGLRPSWVDCPLTDAEVKNFPACGHPMSSTDFIIEILTKTEAERLSSYHEAMGQALECPESEGGCVAYVFYRNIPELASVGNAAEFRLLGHIIAHEIGHMLLGPSHSVAGIMQARWNYTDMKTIVKSFLFFNGGESRRMRDAVLTRQALGQPVIPNPRVHPLLDSKPYENASLDTSQPTEW
jgi:hypothetical protein